MPLVPKENKTPILALVDKATGEVHTRILTGVTGPSLLAAIAETAELSKTVLHTDGHGRYRTLRSVLAGREHVDHSSHEYVSGDVTTTPAESF